MECVVFYKLTFHCQILQCLCASVGIAPISQIVWGVLVWNGLTHYIYEGFLNFKKNFLKKFWLVYIFVPTFGWVGGFVYIRTDVVYIDI
jgi:hypothetical protein